MTLQQQTLRDVLEYSGIGLHTGAPCGFRLRPQPPGTGLRFLLCDSGVAFPAHAEYVVDTRRATIVGTGGATVSTVEHLLSALCGMGIDNGLIEVDGPEIPVADGSAGTFVELITVIGLKDQHVPCTTQRIERPLFFREDEALLIILPAPRWRIRFIVDYPAPVGTHYFDGEIDRRLYANEIAGARTFGYLSEVEALYAAGLARGGSLENALVFADDGPMTPLRWPNEVVRHKVLDLIGDFALLGARPQCEVIAVKSGHKLHNHAVRTLRGAAQRPVMPAAAL